MNEGAVFQKAKGTGNERATFKDRIKLPLNRITIIIFNFKVITTYTYSDLSCWLQTTITQQRMNLFKDVQVDNVGSTKRTRALRYPLLRPWSMRQFLSMLFTLY